MKTAHSTALSILALAIFATGTFAQGRHDEKPHGMTKAPATAEQQARGGGTGGRHDEGMTTHGRKKQAQRHSADPLQDGLRKQ